VTGLCNGGARKCLFWVIQRLSCHGTYNSLMDGSAGRDLAPPHALRPAQLGVILVGRVTLAHIGATVVDLAGRGYLCIELVEDDDPDWQVTALDAEPDELLGYERTLLGGLFDGPQTIRLGLVTARMIPLMDKVRSQIERDAVSAGWLGRGLVQRLLTRVQLTRPGQGSVRRTKAGEELLKEIKAFRRELRAKAGDGDSGALAWYAPYAMIFGLTAPVQVVGSPRESSDAADPRAQTAGFAACWQKAWATAAPPEFWFSWNPFQPVSPGHSTVPGHANHHHTYNHHTYDHHGGGFDGGHGGHGGGFHGGHA
jgi:hypothetical protein